MTKKQPCSGNKKPCLGKLEAVDPRKIWADEARCFTPWLAKNLDLLGEELGLDLELVDTEAKIGDFFADIIATETGSNAKVIIENQLSPTDHNHLGQLLTYASGLDADIIIWIATEFREEHRQAIDWLNQRTDISTAFFGVTISVKKIGNSCPAPDFRVVAFPNTWQKVTKRDTSSLQERYRAFFQKLFDELRTGYGFTNAKKARAGSWNRFPSGYPNIAYAACFGRRSRARVEILLTDDLFDELLKKRTAIEQCFGCVLEWDRGNCKIVLYTDGSIDGTEQELEELREWMVKKFLKFKEVFGPHLGNWFKP